VKPPILALVLAAVLLDTVPVPLPAPSAPGAIVRATLANGMQVVLLPDRLAPVVTTIVQYGVGSDEDTIPGIAHATEHMLFRGTSDVSAAQFADIAARAGAQYDAMTTQIDTLFYFTLPSTYLPVALKLEADRMTNASISADAWRTERGAIEQEVRAHESVPTASMIGRIDRASYGDSPYANDPVGTIGGFERMTAANIAAFYHAWYHPNNATLIVAGDIDTAQTLAEIHAFFDGIPTEPLPAVAPIALGASSASTVDGGVAELPVPVVAFGYRFPAFGDAPFAAGQVLATALNNERGAFHDLVVQGKVLGTVAFAGSLPHSGIGLIAAVGLPTSSPAEIEEALQGVIDEYERDGVPPELVAAAKASLLSEASYTTDSIPGFAFEWSAALLDGYDSPSAYYQAISGVTDDDVNAVLKTFVQPATRTTIVMRPKADASASYVDKNATAENVSYPLDREPSLPQWAIPYFEQALRVPDVSIPQVFHLKNRLTLAVRYEASAPVIVLEGSVRNNTDLNEPIGKDGVADVTDTLLGWGTTTYDRNAYQAQEDAIAANVGLGRDFSLTVQAPNFDRGVALLADGMLHPAFPADAFTLVRNNTAQTSAATEREASARAAVASLYALYPPGDLHRRHATARTIAAITHDDVEKWYELAFRPSLTTISIVGDVTPSDALAIVEKYFGAWSVSGPMPSFDYPPSRAGSERGASVTVTSGAQHQADVTLTQRFAVPRNSREAAILDLANTILSGEGAASLLYEDVRTEKGYVYSIDSAFTVGDASSTFTIDFASDPARVAVAQAAAYAVLNRLREQPLPIAELQRAKALLLAQRVLSMDSYSGLADDLLSDAAYGWTGQDDELYWARLLNITPEELRDAMHRWIDPARFSRVILAPSS
jgi:zinc protease